MSYEALAAELITNECLQEYRATVDRVESRPRSETPETPETADTPSSRRRCPSLPSVRVPSFGRPSIRPA